MQHTLILLELQVLLIQNCLTLRELSS